MLTKSNLKSINKVSLPKKNTFYPTELYTMIEESMRLAIGGHAVRNVKGKIVNIIEQIPLDKRYGKDNFNTYLGACYIKVMTMINNPKNEKERKKVNSIVFYYPLSKEAHKHYFINYFKFVCCDEMYKCYREFNTLIPKSKKWDNKEEILPTWEWNQEADEAGNEFVLMNQLIDEMDTSHVYINQYKASLNKRDKNIIELLEQRYSVREIQEILKVSPNTVIKLKNRIGDALFNDRIKTSIEQANKPLQPTFSNIVNMNKQIDKTGALIPESTINEFHSPIDTDIILHTNYHKYSRMDKVLRTMVDYGYNNKEIIKMLKNKVTIDDINNAYHKDFNSSLTPAQFETFNNYKDTSEINYSNVDKVNNYLALKKINSFKGMTKAYINKVDFLVNKSLVNKVDTFFHNINAESMDIETRNYINTPTNVKKQQFNKDIIKHVVSSEIFE